MAQKKHPVHKKSKKPTEALAIAALLLNVLVLPGLGSIIGGRKDTGIIQIVLTIIAIPLCFILIGIPLLIGVWIWGLVTGIQMVQEATR